MMLKMLPIYNHLELRQGTRHKLGLLLLYIEIHWDLPTWFGIISVGVLGGGLISHHSVFVSVCIKVELSIVLKSFDCAVNRWMSPLWF